TTARDRRPAPDSDARDGEPRLPGLVLDRARPDQGGRLRPDGPEGDVRRRDPARDPRPGARRPRYRLRRRDAPLLLRADVLLEDGRPRAGRAAAQDRALRLRLDAAIPATAARQGAARARRGRGVSVPEIPDREAREGHLPGAGHALDPRPAPARR